MASSLKILFFIGAGSFIGGVARYGLSCLTRTMAGAPSFWGTMAANILGCLFIGILYGLFERHNIPGEHWRMFLTVGFCGGFTTFSTFINENHTMLFDGRFLHAAAYAAASLIICLSAVHIGHLIARHI